MQTCSACIFHFVYNDFLFLIFPEDFFRYLACQLQRPFEEFFLCKFSLFHPCQLRFPSRCECGIRYFHSPYRFIYVKSLSGGNDISSGVSYIFTVNQGLQYAGTGGDGSQPGSVHVFDQSGIGICGHGQVFLMYQVTARHGDRFSVL